MKMPSVAGNGAIEGGWATRNARILVAGEVVLSVALGFYRLGHKSLWNDEGLSAMVTSGSWRSILGRGSAADANARTPTMVGYHSLLKAWREFGTNEAALRSLSIAAVAATVVIVYLLASRLFDRATGATAGFLIAIAPFGVRYAQEARSYALLMFLVTLSSLVFVIAVERDTWGWWIAFAIVASASSYAHIFGLLVLLAQATSLLFVRERRPRIEHLVMTALLSAALLAPLVYLLTAGSQAGSGSRPTLTSALSVASRIAGGKLLFVVLLGLCVVPAYQASRAWRTTGASLATWRLALVLLWIVVPYSVALTVAFAKPYWQERYLITMLPPLAIAAALGLRQIRDRRVFAAALIVIAALSAAKIWNWYRAPAHEDWRAVAATVVDSGRPSDGVVFCIPSVRPAFEYYANSYPTEKRPRPLSPPQPWGDGFHAIEASPREVRTWRTGPERIWVVSRYAQEHATGACDLTMSMRGRRRLVTREVGNVTIERWDLATASQPT